MSCLGNRNRRLTLAAAALTMAIGLSSVAAAQSMVVRSTGPSAAKYPTGKKFKPGERVTLVVGDRLVLLEKGTTRTLAKPGTFSATGPVQISQNMGSTVTRMIARGNAGRSRGGMIRGAPETAPLSAAESRAPNIWLLDYRHGGTFCVADPATLLLWRPDMASDTLLKISASGDPAASSATVALVSGANFRKWPTDILPVQYDVDYHMSGAGLSAPVTIRFKPVAALPETADDAAATLLGNGCTAQLNQLVDAMSEVEASGGI